MTKCPFFFSPPSCTYKFFQDIKFKKFPIEPNGYTAMLLYLFFDSLLSTCPKKMETEKWPKATDSPLPQAFFDFF